MKRQAIIFWPLMSGVLLLSCRLALGQAGSISNIPPALKIPSPPLTLYLTDDGNNSWSGGPGMTWVRTDDFIRMIESSETWPAEQDPEGNWSPVVGGFQISLRFSEKAFTNRQDIVATVLLRNVSDKTLGFLAMRDVGIIGYGGQLGGDFEFEIIGPDNKSLAGKERKYSMRAMHMQIWKGTQKKLPFRLSEEFQFNLPGEYKIRAKTRVRAENGETVMIETKVATVGLK